MKLHVAVLTLTLSAAAPAFAQGAPAWRELEHLRQDRFQLAMAEHVQSRDHRWLAHELAVGNRPAAADLRRQLADDERRIVQARARLRQDEKAGGRSAPSF